MEEFVWFSDTVKMCKMILDVASGHETRSESIHHLPFLGSSSCALISVRSTRPFPKINHATSIVRASFFFSAEGQGRSTNVFGPTRRGPRSSKGLCRERVLWRMAGSYPTHAEYLGILARIQNSFSVPAAR